MKKKHKQKGKATKASKNPKPMHSAAELHEDEPEFSRWALFEAAVLAKVENPEQCKKVIAQRQAQVDDDANEADLVAAYLRKKLRDQAQDPNTCCIFFTTAEITSWLEEAIGAKLAINKTTPYLRTLSIPELKYSKKNGVPGWVWRGGNAKAGQAAAMFSKVCSLPRY